MATDAGTDKNGCLLLALWFVGTVLLCIGTYFSYRHNHSRDFAVLGVALLSAGLLVARWVVSAWNRRIDE